MAKTGLFLFLKLRFSWLSQRRLLATALTREARYVFYGGRSQKLLHKPDHTRELWNRPPFLERRTPLWQLSGCGRNTIPARENSPPLFVAVSGARSLAACGPLPPETTSEQAMPEFPAPGRICPHCGAATPSDCPKPCDFPVSNDAPPALQGLAILLHHINNELERAALETDALGHRLADMRSRLRQARKLAVTLNEILKP